MQIVTHDTQATIEKIQQSLDYLLAPGDVHELRALGSRKGTISGYFNNISSFATCATHLSGQAVGIYITLNPCNPDLLARAVNRTKPYAKNDSATKDEDIIARRWLPLDFDPVRVAGVSANDLEHMAALNRATYCRDMLRNAGWPEPVYADSGNGAHLLYRIELPNDAEAKELVRACLAALADMVDDDKVKLDKSVFNAARIWKCYGTLSAKGDSTETRPHRLSRILAAPDQSQVVSREMLQALARFAPPTQTTAKKTQVADTGRKNNANGGGAIQAFNTAHDVRLLLEQYGYRPMGARRFIAPTSQSQLPGVTLLDDEHCYSHHSSDPLNNGHAHDAFSLFTIYEHNGDVKAAVKAAVVLLGIEQEVSDDGDAAHGAQVAQNFFSADAVQNDEFIRKLEKASLNPSIEIIEPADISVSPVPVPFFDELTQWIDARSHMSMPAVSRHTALALVSAITARRYRSNRGDHCQGYFGLVSESVSETDYTAQALNTIFCSVGLHRQVRVNRFNSPQSLYRTLLRTPSLLYCCDDYGQQVAFSKRQPSGVLEQAMQLLNRLWRGSDEQIDSYDDLGAVVAKALKLGDEITTLYKPAITMLAMISKDHLPALFRSAELGRGAVGRMLFLLPELNQREPVLRIPDNSPPPSDVLQHMLTIHSCVGGGNLQGSEQIAGIPPATIIVDFPYDTSDCHAAFITLLDKERRLLVLAKEAHVMMRRLATALSVWANPSQPVVTPVILDWCYSYVYQLLNALKDRFRIMSTDDGQASVYDKVVEAIVDAGQEGVTERRLSQTVWGFKKMNKEQRAKLVEALIADGTVVYVPKGRTQIFVSKKIVRFDGKLDGDSDDE